MKTVYIDPSIKQPVIFKAVLEEHIKHFKVITSIEECPPETVEVAIIWLEVPQILKEFSNLKLLLVCGSGVDHIINSVLIPHSVSLVRLVDPNLRERVADYVLKYIKMHFDEGMDDENSKKASSKISLQSNGNKKTIGILGLGLVGRAIADKLSNNGFEVYGWVRTSKKRSIKNIFTGPSELKKFATNCNVIVCQLPLTVATKGILNSELFNAMPKGSYLINVGRGGHLNEDDLIKALNSGHLSGACLDVFNIEPLPSDHIFNSNAKIIVTPHTAGIIEPNYLAHYAITVIDDFFMNKKIEGVVDYNYNY